LVVCTFTGFSIEVVVVFTCLAVAVAVWVVDAVSSGDAAVSVLRLFSTLLTVITLCGFSIETGAVFLAACSVALGAFEFQSIA